MRKQLAKRAGSAFIWKGIQLGTVKATFLVRTLILARLLVPDDFGLFAVAALTVEVPVQLTDLGMVPALVQQPQPDGKQYDVAWTIELARALLIAALVFLAAPLLARLFAEPRAIALIRVFALRPVLLAAASIKVAKLTRELRFRSLAFINLADAIANTLVALLLAPAFGAWALLAGALGGSFAYLIMSYILAPHRPQISVDFSAAWPLFRFGRWIFLVSAVTVVAGSLVQLVISRQLGAAELGLYVLAAKLAFIPYEVSSEVAGAVAFPLYAQLQADLASVKRAFRAVVTVVSLLLLPACALLFVLAPTLVENVLGARWTGTVPLIQVLVIVSLIDALGDNIGPALKGIGQPRALVFVEVAQSLILVILLWGLTSEFGVIGAALAWLPAVAASLILSVLFLRQALSDPIRGLMIPLTVIMAVASLCALIALVISHYVPGLFGFLAAGLLGILVYCSLMWTVDRRFALGLGRDMVHAFPGIELFLKRRLAGQEA